MQLCRTSLSISLIAAGIWTVCVPIASGQRLLREHMGASIPLQNGGVTGDALAFSRPLGDVNGDGFDDYILVGLKNREFSGWYEFRSGLNGALLAPRYTSLIPGPFGDNVVLVGDFNGDGREDLVRTSPVNSIEVADLWSGATIAGLSTGVAIFGYGGTVVPLGDINGDGFDDVAVAERSGAERIGIHLGPSGVLVMEFTSFGAGSLSVASSGDLNGDGIADLLIGDFFFNDEVRAVSMADFSTLYTIHADGGCRCLGASFYTWAMAALSDIDGDGVRDFAVSAPAGNSSGNSSGRGFLEFRSGRTGAFLRRVDEPFPRQFEMLGINYVNHDIGKFGLYMHSGGDFNGDGYEDLVVGSPERYRYLDSSGFGAVTVISGYTGEVLVDATPLGQTESTIRRFAEGFLIGDLDGDGLDELAIGWAQDSEGGPQSGQVWIYRGSAGDALSYCPAPLHSGGKSARLQLDGSLSLINDDMWLQVYDGLPGSLCLFLAAAGTHSSPTGTNGLCLGNQGEFRLGQPTLTRLDGLAETELDVTNAPYAASWFPGSTWTLQAVFRDTGAAVPLGRTNALALQWGW
ncbi:FG-GAP-like repeat-containing protein [Saltatorellus ferox]